MPIGMDKFKFTSALGFEHWRTIFASTGLPPIQGEHEMVLSCGYSWVACCQVHFLAHRPQTILLPLGESG